MQAITLLLSLTARSVARWFLDTDRRAVNDGASKAMAPSITARPTPPEKRMFAAVAAQRQISESTLALIAIRAWLDSQSPDLLPNPSCSGPAPIPRKALVGKYIVR